MCIPRGGDHWLICGTELVSGTRIIHARGLQAIMTLL